MFGCECEVIPAVSDDCEKMATCTSSAPSSSATTERQHYLWSSAQRALKDGSPALSRVLLLAVDDATRLANTQLPARAAQRMCSTCYTLLMPGANCRITKQKRKRRPLSRRYLLRVRCESCGACSDHALPTPDSSRATIPGTQHQLKQQKQQKQQSRQQQQQRDKAQSKQKPAKSSQPQGSKRRSAPQTGPESASASACRPAGDSLFGFDFVAI